MKFLNTFICLLTRGEPGHFASKAPNTAIKVDCMTECVPQLSITEKESGYLLCFHNQLHKFHSLHTLLKSILTCGIRDIKGKRHYSFSTQLAKEHVYNLNSEEIKLAVRTYT